MKNGIIRVAVAALVLTLPAVAVSQTAEPNYPTRVIRFIVSASPGGPTDIVARLLGDKLGAVLGQSVVVDNRPGGAMMIGTNAVAKSDPDGYTLLSTSSTPIVTVPLTTKNVPYDVVEELVTVSHLGSTPLALYVATPTQAKTVKEMLEIARTQPSRANYGTYGAGTSAHILNEIMLKQAGVKMVHVTYRGVAPELQALVGGEILTAVGDIGSARPLLESGQIRAIAVTGSKRSSLLPDVPTFAEQGITGLEPLSPWFGLFAPKKTPKAIVDRLSTEVQKIVKTQEFKEKLASLGLEPTGLATEEADKLTREDLVRWKQIIADSGIKFD